jgi:hypothetical protein
LGDEAADENPGENEEDQRSAAELKEFTADGDILREIFGNPFYSATVDPAWLTPTVVGLAQVIYDQRAFARMPELAEALEKEGCTNHDMLQHCRQRGEHVHGCWVVDLILGKGKL